MKLIHTADIHLGMQPDKQQPWAELREKEIWETFVRLIDECNRREAELLLIAGDLFHRQPLVRELREVNYEFSRLEKTKVVLIAGNHDYIGSRSNYAEFPWAEHVTMLLGEDMQTVSFPELSATVTGFSYHTRDILEARLQDVRAPGGGISVLLAHGGDPKDVPIDFKRLALAGFDYAALGHIHKPQQPADRIFYAGSLEPLDKNETGEHGYMFAEIDLLPDGTRETRTEFVPFAKRRYVDLTVPVKPEDTNGSIRERTKQLLTAEGEENLFRIVLSGSREEHLLPDIGALAKLGYVTEVRDETLPEYDFAAIRAANHDNLIGMYIDRIQAMEPQDEVTQKALYYGLKALLD